MLSEARKIIKLFDRGFVNENSRDFIVEKQRDGRERLQIRNPRKAAAHAPAPAPEVIPGFCLFMCLDETGSIGVGGAQFGIDTIDTFRGVIGDARINGIGYVSFGDIMCETYSITTDLDAARARLQAVVDSGGSDPIFFQDGGGDTPENGVDALQVACDALSTSPHAARSQFRYIALRTDNDNFLHNVNDPATVLGELESDLVSKTWLSVGGDQESGVPHYTVEFPASAKIVHGDFAP